MTSQESDDSWNTSFNVNFYWHPIGMVTSNIVQYLIVELEVNIKSMPVKCADKKTEWKINDEDIRVVEHQASSSKKEFNNQILDPTSLNKKCRPYS